MLKKSVIFAVTIVLAAAAGVSWSLQRENPEWKAKRSQMLASLKDPQSVVLAEQRASGPFLCGTINAKNSYGAYVGARRFVAFENGYAIEGSMLTSWPPEEEHTKDVIDLMATKINWYRASDRPIDLKTEHQVAFRGVWDRACGTTG